ncbi:hypothetical protein QBC46DRAFT_124709 [Diplogelasinospora grovesii]|uniref:Uncharacterized protein n=1 Tax=Diplogelasinospora grovesii TaxID=303347 RepID=A0AAN6NA31_9PEZI|nr:hypothetical protein QBC46DRAFT_124709 [Diplogelasinospora grovesii]
MDQRRVPTPNYDIEEHWRWPAWKFGLEPEDLFTTLYDRFNTTQAAIQEPSAFFYDVRDLAQRSDTIEEFYAGLSERRAQRLRELSDAWHDIALLLTVHPAPLDKCRCKGFETQHAGALERGSSNKLEQWGRFLNLARMMSFDAVVAYFDGYVKEERERRNERREETRKQTAAWEAARKAAKEAGEEKDFDDLLGDEYWSSDEPYESDADSDSDPMPATQGLWPPPRTTTVDCHTTQPEDTTAPSSGSELARAASVAAETNAPSSSPSSSPPPESPSNLQEADDDSSSPRPAAPRKKGKRKSLSDDDEEYTTPGYISPPRAKKRQARKEEYTGDSVTGGPAKIEKKSLAGLSPSPSPSLSPASPTLQAVGADSSPRPTIDSQKRKSILSDDEEETATTPDHILQPQATHGKRRRLHKFRETSRDISQSKELASPVTDGYASVEEKETKHSAKDHDPILITRA